MSTAMKKTGGMVIGLAAGAAVGAMIGAACARPTPAMQGFKKKAAKAFRSLGSVADAVGYFLK